MYRDATRWQRRSRAAGDCAMSPRWGPGLPTDNAETLKMKEVVLIAQTLGALYDTNLVQTGVMMRGPVNCL